MLNKTFLQIINRDVTIVRRTGQAKLEINNQRETHMNLSIFFCLRKMHDKFAGKVYTIDYV